MAMVSIHVAIREDEMGRVIDERIPIPRLRQARDRASWGLGGCGVGNKATDMTDFNPKGFCFPCQIIELTDSLPGQVCWRDSYLDVDFGKISTLSIWVFVNQALVAAGMWKKVGVEAQGSSETTG